MTDMTRDEWDKLTENEQDIRVRIATVGKKTHMLGDVINYLVDNIEANVNADNIDEVTMVFNEAKKTMQTARNTVAELHPAIGEFDGCSICLEVPGIFAWLFKHFDAVESKVDEGLLKLQEVDLDG